MSHTGTQAEQLETWSEAAVFYPTEIGWWKNEGKLPTAILDEKPLLHCVCDRCACLKCYILEDCEVLKDWGQTEMMIKLWINW